MRKTTPSPIKRLAALAAILALALAPGLFSGAAGTASALTIEIAPQVRPFGQAELVLNLPEAGTLEISALIGGESFLLFEQQAAAGEMSLPFRGLAVNGEPLPRAQAVITTKLTGADRVWEGTASTRILAPADGLLYALLSRDSLPAQGGEDLFVDHQLSKKGALLVTLYDQSQPETPLFSRAYPRGDDLPHTYRWDKTINGKPAPPGLYRMVLAAQGSTQQPIEHEFTLTAEPPVDSGIQVNQPGTFLPSSMEHGDVWQAMMAPVTVVDIGDMQHQAIHERPDTASPSLGMVHGQTAGLEVLELPGGGFAKVRAARHGDGALIEGYVPMGKLKSIAPNQRYGLLLDKGSQTLTVYENGLPLGSLKVSTGVYVPPGTDSFDTVPGAFLTQDRIAAFNSEGYRYTYATRIDGGNLIHSAGYKVVSGAPDYTAQQAELGQPASHGCVRADNRISPEGLNAWWLYANLPRNTKVLVLEGTKAHSAPATEPAVTEQAMEPAASEEPAGMEPGAPATHLPVFQVYDENTASMPAGEDRNASLPPPPLGRTRITLTFGGDCVLGSEEQSRKLPESFHSIIEAKGEAWPFSGLEDIFQTDDLTMVNLENVLKDNAKGLNPRLHNFRGPSSFANILKTGGVDLVNLANNHFPDYGQDGKNSTRAALRAAGIPYAGYSSLHVYEKDGIKVGFAGIRETVFHQNRKRISDEIEQLKAQGCDYIVYTCHFGIEYEEKHNELQTLIARTAIDAGANLVIGHHTHIVQGIEEYKNGLIFYSLGNLVFGGNLELSTFDGLVAQVALDFEGETLKQTGVRLIPVITSGVRPQNDFRPQPATGEDKARILATIHKDSIKAYPEAFILP